MNRGEKWGNTFFSVGLLMFNLSAVDDAFGQFFTAAKLLLFSNEE